MSHVARFQTEHYLNIFSTFGLSIILECLLWHSSFPSQIWGSSTACLIYSFVAGLLACWACLIDWGKKIDYNRIIRFNSGCLRSERSIQFSCQLTIKSFLFSNHFKKVANNLKRCYKFVRSVKKLFHDRPNERLTIDDSKIGNSRQFRKTIKSARTSRLRFTTKIKLKHAQWAKEGFESRDLSLEINNSKQIRDMGLEQDTCRRHKISKNIEILHFNAGTCLILAVGVSLQVSVQLVHIWNLILPTLHASHLSLHASHLVSHHHGVPRPLHHSSREVLSGLDKSGFVVKCLVHHHGSGSVVNQAFLGWLPHLLLLLHSRSEPNLLGPVLHHRATRYFELHGTSVKGNLVVLLVSFDGADFVLEDNFSSTHRSPCRRVVDSVSHHGTEFTKQFLNVLVRDSEIQVWDVQFRALLLAHLLVVEWTVLLHLLLRSESHLRSLEGVVKSHWGSLLYKSLISSLHKPSEVLSVLEVHVHGSSVHHSEVVSSLESVVLYKTWSSKLRSPHTAHATEVSDYVSSWPHLVKSLPSVLEESFSASVLVKLSFLYTCSGNLSIESDVSGFDNLIQSLIHFMRWFFLLISI